MDKEIEAASDNLTQTVRLHSGAALKFSEIHSITRQSYTPIVFLTGDLDSGKTTLLGSIHDAFQFGPLSGYAFAGSETLMAFEERCFEARARSGASCAHTPRTHLESGQEYFHLRLRKVGEKESLRHILLGDMSGEYYERAIQSASELAQFDILRHSDYMVLLLDGEKLMDDFARQKVRNDASQFVRRCREGGLLGDKTALQVLISKWDLVLDTKSAEANRIREFVASKFDSSALRRQVDVIPIAARPGPQSHIEKLFGVKPLFSDWVEATPAIFRSSLGDIKLPVANRVFNRIAIE